MSEVFETLGTEEPLYFNTVFNKHQENEISSGKIAFLD